MRSFCFARTTADSISAHWHRLSSRVIFLPLSFGSCFCSHSLDFVVNFASTKSRARLTAEFAEIMHETRAWRVGGPKWWLQRQKSGQSCNRPRAANKSHAVRAKCFIITQVVALYRTLLYRRGFVCFSYLFRFLRLRLRLYSHGGHSFSRVNLQINSKSKRRVLLEYQRHSFTEQQQLAPTTTTTATMITTIRQIALWTARTRRRPAAI